MAISLSSLQSTKTTRPPIAILYGIPGVGKTSLAAEWPDPVYLATPGEEPPADVDMATPGEVESLDQVLDFIGELLTAPHEFKTLIVDSLDGLEPMVWAAACAQNGWQTIEEPGYGKGYVAADEVWREYLRALGALRNAGMAVVQIAHTDITRFESPTSDPYSRYGIKLHKRASALVTEDASLIGFMSFRITLKEKDQGFGKKAVHGEGGGDRQVHLEERPGFIAKNRFGMPPSMPFRKGAGYTELAKFFPSPEGVR
ncbi:ATP-binding protein [Kaustia mangrovi]|uniref:ATP-binding protein n=1 Tax=Kaustia mangrovi TaxID=2593653 RepID=A0A7S8C5B0_9HYPH|nr:ATP-binding protein [Kaustia mangrovi]QPC43474.1 ATP-binding protein [Kaustia mangrovi]